MDRFAASREHLNFLERTMITPRYLKFSYPRSNVSCYTADISTRNITTRADPHATGFLKLIAMSSLKSNQKSNQNLSSTAPLRIRGT